MFKKIIKNFPIIKELVEERDNLYSELSGIKRNKLFVQPGHFYSPIPSLDDVKSFEQNKLIEVPREIEGINLREKEQMALLEKFKTFYDEIPFKEKKQDNLRYYFENRPYSYSDGIFLHCMIRHAQPKRVIEVGSGYSSCVTLDTNELFFQNKIQTTFIEPYPELFLSLINGEDKNRVKLISSNLQDVSLEEFSQLEENDILFIDSTHVAKINSDVNYIFSKILPSLSKGVYIHFHDIFYPFEYPLPWVYENRAWNELYMLRSFLQYNSTFQIVAFNTFLEYFHKDYFLKNMPLCMKNIGGSIWLQKVKDN